MSFVKGNYIHISLKVSDYPEDSPPIIFNILPDGYSYSKIMFLNLENISKIGCSKEVYPQGTVLYGFPVATNIVYEYPVINSKSPSTINVAIADKTKPSKIDAIILKFGERPDKTYFDKVFTPILVVGDDGKEYNVIPSDQFK